MAGQRRRLLPVGSVVTCSGCGRPVMMAGRMAADESGRQRDYVGKQACPFTSDGVFGQTGGGYGGTALIAFLVLAVVVTRNPSLLTGLSPALQRLGGTLSNLGGAGRPAPGCAT